ncbi:MAG: hypothetical protein CVT89_05680, partial [Candidatus Altiarchaeales archaeon HGW-Altiarchaeales-2]
MKIFVFEYATALNAQNFIAEGKAMLNLIIRGLRKERIKVCTLSNNKQRNFLLLHEKILENVRNSDNTILIAPNYELLTISSFLGHHNIFDKVLISPINALNKTLNKFNLYEELNNKIIAMPKTIEFSNFYIGAIKFPIIIKPIYGTGCGDTYVFKDSKSY